MNAYPIEISQLSKDFGKTRVLNNVNLTVAHGTVHGFLGPNGAGKSTTIRCLLGLIHPTTGTLRIKLIEQTFINIVRERRNEGAAILLSSHILSEVQELADDISIIRNGTIVESGSLKQLAHIRGVRIRATNPDYDHIHEQDSVNPTLQHLIDQGASNITITPASLEELFLEFYQDGQGKPAQQQEAQGNQGQQQGGNSHA